MESINLNKLVLDKNFSKTTDFSFNQFKPQQQLTSSIENIDDFFIRYEQIFYEIPKEQEVNSHRYMLRRSADYLGVNLEGEGIDVQALLEEITNLRQSLLDASKNITENNG